MLIKLRSTHWQLYADGRLCTTLPVPLRSLNHFMQHRDEVAPDAEEEGFFQKTGAFTLDDDFLTAPDDEAPLGAWEPVAGKWRLHTTHDDALSQKSSNRLEKRPVKAEYGTNFYSLKGKGSPGLLLGGYDFYDLYRLETAVRTQPGEAGLVFYHRGEEDYLAFTLTVNEKESHPATLRLIQVTPGMEGKEQTLAAVATPLTHGQWVKLRVVLSPGRIRCFLDESTAIDHRLTLPPGGQLGLYVNAANEIQFDDFAAGTNAELDLSTPEGIRLHTLAETGRITAALPRTHSGEFSFTPRATRGEQRLILGGETTPAHVLSATFTPLRKRMDAGLVVGFRGEEAPYWRSRCIRRRNQDQLSIERISGSDVETVTSTATEVSDPASPVTLMADTTADNTLRLYRNGRLILIQPLTEPMVGASGLWMAPRSSARISSLEHRPGRPELSRSRFEKNRIFATDPYMRHWSSPEGEWLTNGKGETWHKSDFLGRFQIRLPIVEGGEVHLGIPESKTTGPVRMLLTKSKLSLLPTNPSNPPLLSVKLPSDAQRIDLFHEDGLLWVQVDGKAAGQTRLPSPFTGRRIRIHGFTAKDLQKSFTVRHQTRDFLFTQAPTEWIQNGGRWQVINRFACQPRWSHMNGESRTTFAGMWSKLRFAGDFCAEMYVGTRHAGRWYNRLGDLNLTVMSDTTSPSRGYTAACTEYDPDHSQEFSTLYRNGTPLDRSDAYLLPRYRAGNKRRWFNPLIQAGKRDVHGAWYYIKMRRIGKRLEYYFDNEKIFTTTDDEPLNDGRLGIWTYMSSMMVARVKITADTITPIHHDFTPVPSLIPSKEVVPSSDWKTDDPVGHAQLTRHKDRDGSPYTVLTNQIGSGPLHLASAQDPTPRRKIVGWRFKVKRRAGTHVDFHYSAGVLTKDEFQPRYHGYHRLSGTDEGHDKWKQHGATPIPANTADSSGWHRQGEWTEVTVRLPEHALHKVDPGQTFAIKIDGFGALQAGRDAQGLTGNGPGSAYAVRDLIPIPLDETAVLVKPTLRWHSTRPAALQLISETPATVRALAGASVRMGSIPVIPTAEGWGRYRIDIPRNPAFLRSATQSLPLNIYAGKQTWALSIPWNQATLIDRPLLQSISGKTFLFDGFDGPPTPFCPRGARTALVPTAPEENESALATWNTAYNQRLTLPLNHAGTMAQFPIFSFRYKAPRMANISLRINARNYVNFSEDYAAAIGVRESGRPVQDATWRRWTGFISDAIGTQPASHGIHRIASYLMFRSASPKDQTGRLTRWHVDDLTAGPAVSTKRPLTLTPDFFDFDGIRDIHYALVPGLKGYEDLSPEARAKPTWKKAKAGQPLTPALAGLPQGATQLLLKATDTIGNSSRVYSLPFLYDTKAPTVKTTFTADKTPGSNGTRLTLSASTHNGAPLDLSAVRFHWGKKRVNLHPYLSTVVHGKHADTLHLNWPYLFRQHLNNLQDGENGSIRITQLVDGAGNAAKDITLPITINTAKDKAPPALLPPRFGKAVLLAPTWYGRALPAGTILRPYSRNTTTVIHPYGKEPYLRTLTHGSNGEIYWQPNAKQSWKLTDFPYIALRLQRPGTGSTKKRIEDRSSLQLYLQVKKGAPISIVLTHASAKDKKKPNTKELIPLEAWKGGKWVTCVIDLRKHLRKRQNPKQVEILKVRLLRRGAVNQQPLHLSSLVVAREWTPKDRLTIPAYDASGVTGLTWKQVSKAGKELRSGTVKGAAIAPATLGLTPTPGDWLTVHAHDRAGHLSQPVRIPLLVPPPPKAVGIVKKNDSDLTPEEEKAAEELADPGDQDLPIMKGATDSKEAKRQKRAEE
jgi:hypothetical protein